MKFDPSQFLELTDLCYNTGEYSTVIDHAHPTAMVKLDMRNKDPGPGNYQVFDCVIKVETDIMNNEDNDNQDIALMMFDINQESKRSGMPTA